MPEVSAQSGMTPEQLLAAANDELGKQLAGYREEIEGVMNQKLALLQRAELAESRLKDAIGWLKELQHWPAVAKFLSSLEDASEPNVGHLIDTPRTARSLEKELAALKLEYADVDAERRIANELAIQNQNEVQRLRRLISDFCERAEKSFAQLKTT